MDLEVVDPTELGETIIHVVEAIPGRKSTVAEVLHCFAMVLNSELLSIDAPPAPPGEGGEALRDIFAQLAERVFPRWVISSFGATAVAWEWLWSVTIPMPVVLFLFFCFITFVRARGIRAYIHFWGQLLLFVFQVVVRLPGFLWEVFFTERIVDSPFPLWFVRFWVGFLGGLFGSLGTLFTGRGPVERIPPLSPPPTPPVPLSPLPIPRRPLNAYFLDEDEEEDDMLTNLRRGAMQLEDEIVRDWQQRRDRADEVERQYERARLAHEARAADRARRERDITEQDEMMARTGREPRTVRGEFGYWWPWLRIVVPALAVLGITLGVIFYCESLEAGAECGWFTRTLCGGEGVGRFESLGYDDEPIRLANVEALGIPRFRFLSDGTRVQLPDF